MASNTSTLLKVMLSPTSTITTENFLNLCKTAIILDGTNDILAFRRFSVEKIGLYKCGDNSEHEFIVVDVKDEEEEFPKTRLVLQRMPTEDVSIRYPEAVEDTKFAAFLQHPRSEELLNTVKNKASLIPLPSIPSFLTVNSETPPLLPLTNPEALFDPPRHTIIDKASLAGFSKLHTSRIISEPVDSPALDEWLGSTQLDVLEFANASLQFEFAPVKASLFELALLANVVHEEYPLYSLFDKQCYWFGNTIIRAMIALFGFPLSFDSPDHTLPDLQLPNTQGRWRGVKVSDVSPTILASVMWRYHTRLEKETRNVILLYFLLYYQH